MENQNTKHQMWIEIDKTGVLGVHGDITDTPFLSLIGLAIVKLDRFIQDLQPFTGSEAFARLVQDAVEKHSAETATTSA